MKKIYIKLIILKLDNFYFKNIVFKLNLKNFFNLILFKKINIILKLN